MRDALFADFEQRTLSRVQHLERRLALVCRARNGRRADGHEPPQQALVLHDADVLVNHWPQRQPLGQGREVSHAAHRFDLLVAGQLV